MAKKPPNDSAFRFAREWEERSHQQLVEREERETEPGRQSIAQRRQIANRVVAEYRATIAERGRAKWDQLRPNETKWQRLTDEELFAIYGRK